MLLWAVRTENTPVVMALLQEENISLDVNETGPENITPLNLAAAEGHVVIFKLLLKHGAFLDSATANGVTPLLSAVYHGKTAVMQLLASLNKDKPNVVGLDRPDDAGKTPLILAAGRGFDGVVKVILAHGANKDARDIAGMSTMAHAAKKGYSAVAEQLLAHGADLNLKDKENATPLL